MAAVHLRASVATPDGSDLSTRGLGAWLARAAPAAARGEVSVAVVSDRRVRALNRQFRGKDAVTDVLSFASGFPVQSGELGDVLISYAQALRQSEDGDVELECVDLVVHGILHVLGYDHERAEDADVMFPLQDRIVAASL